METRQDRTHLAPGEHDGQRLRPARAHDALDPIKRLLQDVLVEEQDGRQRLVLRGGGNAHVDGQVSQERVGRVLAEESDPPVPGLHRERAYGEGGYWAGVVRLEPGMETQWHHHGDYDTFVYTRAGAFCFETAEGDVTEGEGAGPP